MRDDIYVGTYEEQEDIERRILMAKSRLWRVKALVVLMNLINFLVFTGSCVWFKMVVDSSGSEDYLICQGEAAYDSLPVNQFFSIYWVIMSFLIDFWLVSVVTLLVVVLDKNIEFKKEKRKINIIIWSFLVSYILWSIWTLVDISLKNEAVFIDIIMGDLIMPSLCTLVPIFLVMYVHFNNVFSLKKIVDIGWIRESLGH